MSEYRNQYRDIVCEEIDESGVGKQIKLAGWVNRRRDHGGVIFIDLRDHSSVAQIVFDPEKLGDDKQTFEVANQLRSDFVISVEGTITKRPEESINPEISTGKVEILAQKCLILNRAEDLAFRGYEGTSEETRLANRVLDLRRDEMQANLRLRSKVSYMLRVFLSELKFTEIETPILTRETPEGARDYLVPSRTQQGSFFALPQSPQLFKQLLMIGGFDRYYQFARCFRDEDLRADRQPEFTQLDMEMAFITERDIMQTAETMIRMIFWETIKVDLSDFPVMTYEKAMELYGTDRPDLRSELKLQTINDLVKNCDFKVFSAPAQDDNSRVALLKVPDGGKNLSRKDIDELTDYVVALGAKGLAYIRVDDKSQGIEGIKSPITKFLGDELTMKIIEEAKAENGDIIFFGAGKESLVNKYLGELRLKVSHKLNLIKDEWQPVWITEFPMFEALEDGKNTDNITGSGITPLHHPFTAPLTDSASLDVNLDKPLSIKSRAYDMVINGTEIGGGSIRISDHRLQQKMFDILGIEDATDKFDFLLKALKSGAPPHGGIAFGLDRLLMILGKGDTIRDYIAFPKTQTASCLLTGAPREVSSATLRELGIKHTKPKLEVSPSSGKLVKEA